MPGGSALDDVAQLREENERLRAELRCLRDERVGCESDSAPGPARGRPAWDARGHGLSREQVERYSRQLILRGFGVDAQARVCAGSVLVVGAGGLGSPAALYLAAAGVGRLGIVDRDAVELSNLHRQVIHSEARVGAAKAASAAAAVAALNSGVAVEPHGGGLTAGNALELVGRYDVVLDASDNAPTRYLISDACAVLRKPLVSGAAIGLEGQLTVYCHGQDGPCYRCLFPEPPAAGNCARCADAGVLGPVPGVIGTLQAVEALKLLSGVGEPLSRRLLLYDAAAGCFHTVQLRARVPACAACGAEPAVTHDSLPGYDYSAFTGQPPHDAPPPAPLRLLPPEHRIVPAQLQARLVGSSAGRPVLLDVRSAEQYALCALSGSIHIPLAQLDSRLPDIQAAVAAAAASHAATAAAATAAEAGAGDISAAGVDAPVVVVCRRGNDSQRAVVRLRAAGVPAVDVVGGVEAWARQVDPGWPLY